MAIELIGTGGAFAASLLGHAVVIGALLLMKTGAPVTVQRESMVVSVVRGVRDAASRANVFWVLTFSLMVGTLGFTIISTLAPYWMRHELGLGPVGWTFMGWLWGLGTLASTAYLSTHDVKERLGSLVLISAAGFGLTLVVFGLTRWLPLAAAMWCLNGTFYSANMISSTSLLQLLVESAYGGRVMSLCQVSPHVSSLPITGLKAQVIGCDFSTWPEQPSLHPRQ